MYIVENDCTIESNFYLDAPWYCLLLGYLQGLQKKKTFPGIILLISIKYFEYFFLVDEGFPNTAWWYTANVFCGIYFIHVNYELYAFNFTKYIIIINSVLICKKSKKSVFWLWKLECNLLND